MSEPEVTRDVSAIFRDTLPELEGKDLDLDKKYTDFEQWDSFAQMELVGKVEKKFNVSFKPEEVVRLDTPRQFVAGVIQKLSPSP